MIDFRNSLNKNNELHRKKLVNETENLVHKFRAQKKDDLLNIIAVAVAFLSSVTTSCLLPYLLSEKIISAWELFWIVPVFIVGFLAIYFLTLGITKLLMWCYVQWFSYAKVDTSYEKLKSAIDKFDITIMTYIANYYSYREEYNYTKEKGAKKMFELMQVKYYISKSAMLFSEFNPSLLAKIISDGGNEIIEDRHRTRLISATCKIERYRFSTVLDLTDHALEDLSTLLKDEKDDYIQKFTPTIQKEIEADMDRMKNVRENFEKSVQ